MESSRSRARVSSEIEDGYKNAPSVKPGIFGWKSLTQRLVPEGRFELPRAQGPLRPERSASTSSTTPALFRIND